MFSVGASPFNSLARQTYGGWISNLGVNAPEAGTRAIWDADAAQFYQDNKWANMAMRFSMDPSDRLRAARIKEIAKGYLRNKRDLARTGDGTALGWLANYNMAGKAVRSPYRITGLSPAQRQNIFATFENVAWNPNGLSDADRLALSMANRAPFQATPALPEGVAIPENILSNFTTNQAGYAIPEKLTIGSRRALAAARTGLTFGGKGACCGCS